MSSPSVAILGGGPAGLMAAEVLVAGGVEVHVFDRMPSMGRKFLMAGRGGLNLTHAEPLEAFLDRYGDRRPRLEVWLRDFGPDALRAWARELGVETFVGSSRRVFPLDMKAAPLLRSWLHRLQRAGCRFHGHHRWVGWGEDGRLAFQTPDGTRVVDADAVVLALGGASWSRLGSDGAWVPLLNARGVRVERLRPANCGFEVAWSAPFRERFAGQPVKSVAATGPGGLRREGEFVVTATGVEGSLVYTFSALLRDEIARSGSATLLLDLVPGRDPARLEKELSAPRGSRTLAEHLRRKAGIEGVKVGLIREHLPAEDLGDPARLVSALKALPLRLVTCRPLEEAISTAGGVAFEDLDENLMMRNLPGCFCAGEMLDWEAPTGGYLLTACFATGRAAGLGALAWLAGREPSPRG